MKVPGKSTKICPKSCGILVFKQTLVCRVDIPLIFKNVRRKKKVYNKYKPEKIPKADSAPRSRSENGASCQNC